MSYTVTLRGGDKYPLDESDGFDLKVKWLGAKKPFACELGEDTIMSGQITKITRNKVTQADIPNFTQAVLGEGNRCKAQYSIQLEINRLAKSEGHKWAKLIADKSWREETRQKLRETGAQWCDYRAGECACDGIYQPAAGRHNVSFYDNVCDTINRKI